MLFAGGSWENRSQYWENDVCNKCRWVNMIDPPKSDALLQTFLADLKVPRNGQEKKGPP